MKEGLTKQEKELIKSKWKIGIINITKINIPNKLRVVKKLEDFKLLKKFGEYDYKIDRGRFLDLDKEIIQNRL